MGKIPAVGNSEMFLDPVFPTIYEFGPIQLSDTLMADGYFHIFLTNKVTKMCPNYLLTLYHN